MRGVTDAVKQISLQLLDVLVTDIHMPNAGDGFTVVTAMRHSQPKALTMVVSDYPDVEKAMADIGGQADDVLLKPSDSARLAEIVGEKLLTSRYSPKLPKRTSPLWMVTKPSSLNTWCGVPDLR